MSSQVSDLYKKYNEIAEELKKLREENNDLTQEVDKVKLENKDLQSEIILLVKQMASLEKLVHTKYMNSGPGAPVVDKKDSDDSLYSTGNAGWTYGKKSQGATDSRHPNPLLKPKTGRNQYYVVNPKTKGLEKNPDYKPSDDDHFDESSDDDVPF